VKKYLVIPLFLCSLFIKGQQNVKFEKENFKNDILGFNKAMDSIKAGDDIYKLGPTRYELALPAYLYAENFNPNNDKLNYLIGVCMLCHNSPFKARALTYLQKALKLNPAVAPDIHYELARAYHLNMDWELAKQQYNRYLLTLKPNKDADAITDVKKKIEECNTGEELVKHPVNVTIDNMGANINSQYPEYAPLISADESELFYTSKRSNETCARINEESGQCSEDIYTSYFINGAWAPATEMDQSMNIAGNNATADLSVDGQTLYIYRESNGGDIFQSHLEGTTWSKPEPLTDKINTKYYETSLSIGPDGRTFYFVSTRPGGFGGRDIYKIVNDGNDNWGEVENLGPVINTMYDEEGVAIQADGKTLYFSSQGHNTMGGYDVFKSVYNRNTNQWSVPENLGYPINTPDDDVFFSISANGKHGYYSSIRRKGFGDDDIYRITFLDVVKSVKKTPRLTLLKGVITDSLTHKPLKAAIELVDNSKNTVIASFHSNSVTGKYLVSLPDGINYGIYVTAPGYLFYSDNFDLPDTSSYREVVKNVALQSLNIGSSIVLRNIFYDFDKATLRPESKTELDRITALLTTNATLKIQISAFTDNIGTDDYNMDLSARRAQSVVDYLTTHGIDAARLIYKGYGKTNPIATNETDYGRQLNRRTEFKIIGK